MDLSLNQKKWKSEDAKSSCDEEVKTAMRNWLHQQPAELKRRWDKYLHS